jgi:hypothetical protein
MGLRTQALPLVSRVRSSEHYLSPIVIARSAKGDEAISPGFSSTARGCFASLAMTRTIFIQRTSEPGHLMGEGWEGVSALQLDRKPR